MPHKRALVSVTRGRRILNVTRGQFEAAIKAGEIPVVEFPGHRFRYVTEDALKKFSANRLARC